MHAVKIAALRAWMRRHGYDMCCSGGPEKRLDGRTYRLVIDCAVLRRERLRFISGAKVPFVWQVENEVFLSQVSIDPATDRLQIIKQS